MSLRKAITREITKYRLPILETFAVKLGNSLVNRIVRHGLKSSFTALKSMRYLGAYVQVAFTAVEVGYYFLQYCRGKIPGKILF
jgi:hypothetical protein